MVVVYSKPGCQPCRMTKKVLESQGVPFEEKDVTADPEALRTVQALGYLGVPVVVASPENHWQGLDPDRLKGLASPS